MQTLAMLMTGKLTLMRICPQGIFASSTHVPLPSYDCMINLKCCAIIHMSESMFGIHKISLKLGLNLWFTSSVVWIIFTVECSVTPEMEQRLKLSETHKRTKEVRGCELSFAQFSST